jgi:uncharacterized protein (TIGR03083 family)
MDPASYPAALASEGEALAGAATGHLEEAVPACPNWNVAQLVGHMGGVHGWVRQVIAAGGERIGPRELATPPDEPAALLAWYRDGLARLVEALSVDPDTPAWTFLPTAPDNVGWWRRRQALETAMHRWDAQAAAGPSRDPIPVDLAVDGVDELLMDFLPGVLSARPVSDLTGTLHLHATDTAGEWWLDFDAEGLASRREHAKADTAVRGAASGLYLWLWNRQTPEAAGLEVFGRPETVSAWRAVTI